MEDHRYPKKQLVKSEENQFLCGLCGGIAEYYSVDASWIRMLFVGLSLFGGIGVLLYMIAALIVPMP